jgi:hypothetical protein
MCIGNTTSPAANSTINWYPREEERVTTLQEGPQMGDQKQATPKGKSTSTTKTTGTKQSSKY